VPRRAVGSAVRSCHGGNRRRCIGAGPHVHELPGRSLKGTTPPAHYDHQPPQCPARRRNPGATARASRSASSWNRPEGGSSTQVLDSAGNLSTRLSAAPRNLVAVLHPECAFGAQPTWASALPAPQRHGAVTRVACRATVEWSPDRPPQQPRLGLQPMPAYENHHRGNPQHQENDYSAV
jgi:hypothetical protein